MLTITLTTAVKTTVAVANTLTKLTSAPTRTSLDLFASLPLRRSRKALLIYWTVAPVSTARHFDRTPWTQRTVAAVSTVRHVDIRMAVAYMTSMVATDLTAVADTEAVAMTVVDVVTASQAQPPLDLKTALTKTPLAA